MLKSRIIPPFIRQTARARPSGHVAPLRAATTAIRVWPGRTGTTHHMHNNVRYIHRLSECIGYSAGGERQLRPHNGDHGRKNPSRIRTNGNRMVRYGCELAMKRTRCVYDTSSGYPVALRRLQCT